LDSNNHTEIIDRHNIRPWVRYWARYIDVYLFTIFIVMLQQLLFPTKQMNLSIAVFGLHFVWVLVEAQLLATWGTTPGKWLLKIKVRDADNNKLSLKTSLTRGFLVWSVGMAMYTVFSTITEAISYMNLQNKGTTVWDKYCNTRVTHEDFGTERIPLIIGVLILPLFILSALYSTV
jgi:uncharacterized RDD family membrane protein YckC